MSTKSLHALYDPASIAVIGASDDPDKIGGRSIGYLKDYGYGGRVFPVNPKRDFVQGHKAFNSIRDIDADVDLAIIATPAARVLEELESCGQQGVSACVVLSSGFGEMRTEGKHLEERMAGLARRYSMRVLGPNCQGVANMSTGAVGSFSTCFATHRVADGDRAVVSQSGAVAGMLSDLHSARSVGLRYWAATGNEADVGVPELVLHALRDPHVRVVEAYCEQLKQVSELRDAAAYADQVGKAILMLKSAVTKSGTTAAGSHTGALAQDDAIIDAFFHRHGIVRASSLRELVDFAAVFASTKAAPGNRAAIVTNSGGLGVMMADRCTGSGLELAELHADTKGALRRFLPDFAAAENPVDVTAELLNNGRLLADALPVLASDPEVDVVLVGLGIVGRGYDVSAITEDLEQVSKQYDALVAVCWLGGDPSAIADLAERGIPVFTDDAACVRAVGRYAEHCARQRSSPPAASRSDSGSEPTNLGDTLESFTHKASASGFLSENASKQFLRESRLPVVDGFVVQSPDTAVTMARRLGLPVAVKLSSAQITHKSELGLVLTNLATEEEVYEAATAVLARGRAHGIASIDGLLVERMAPGDVEIAVGAKWDDTFGPVLLLATGGIHIETRAEYQLLLPPVTRFEIEAAIKSLSVYPMIHHHRTHGPLDLAALVGLVERFSRMIMTAGPRILEVDLNPVFVAAVGGGVTIADALIRLSPASDGV